MPTPIGWMLASLLHKALVFYYLGFNKGTYIYGSFELGFINTTTDQRFVWLGGQGTFVLYANCVKPVGVC